MVTKSEKVMPGMGHHFWQKSERERERGRFIRPRFETLSFPFWHQCTDTPWYTRLKESIWGRYRKCCKDILEKKILSGKYLSQHLCWKLDPSHFTHWPIILIDIILHHLASATSTGVGFCGPTTLKCQPPGPTTLKLYQLSMPTSPSLGTWFHRLSQGRIHLSHKAYLLGHTCMETLPFE